MNALARHALAAALLTLALGAAPTRADTGSEGSPCLLRWVTRSTTPATRCLACHDGSVGPRIASGPLPTSGSHPAGVSYALAAARGSGFRPAAMLASAGIVLVNGEVACTSCHDGRSREPKHLAVSVDRLCVGCHQR